MRKLKVAGGIAVVSVSIFLIVAVTVGGAWLYRSTPISRSLLQADSIEEITQIAFSTTTFNQLTSEIAMISPLFQSGITRNFMSFFLPSVVMNDLEYLLENEVLLIGLLTELQTTISSNEQARVRVLLQNDMEIRPSGGFLGSYADLVFDHGSLNEILIQDIYEPDGQVVGYIKPPEPIEQYLFQSGGWKLRDANWDPDFSRSAEAVDWFFAKAEYPESNMMFGITLGLMEQIFEILAPVYLPDYGFELTAEQMYSFIQRETEQEFFPGATNKRDVISAVTRAMIRRFSDLEASEKLRAVSIILKGAHARELQVWSPNIQTQQNLQLLGLNGGLFSMICENHALCVSDYLYLVEANLGINKANCCIERHVSIRYRFEESGEVSRRISIQYNNINPITPNPPKQYGGGYLNYLRVYTTEDWLCNSMTVSDQFVDLDRRCNSIPALEPGLQERTVPLLVQGGEKGELVLEEVLPIKWTTLDEFKVGVQRQSGTRTNSYVIELEYPEGYQFSLNDEPYLNPVSLELLAPTTLTFTHTTR